MVKFDFNDLHVSEIDARVFHRVMGVVTLAALAIDRGTDVAQTAIKKWYDFWYDVFDTVL